MKYDNDIAYSYDDYVEADNFGEDALEDYEIHKMLEEKAEVIYPARQTGKSHRALKKLIRKMVIEYMEGLNERDRQVESETSNGTREE